MGLTLVGGLAMAITIGLRASMFTIWETVTGTRWAANFRGNVAPPCL